MGTNALFAFEKKGRTKLKLLIFRKHGLEIMFSGLSSFRKRSEETIFSVCLPLGKYVKVDKPRNIVT